MGRSQDHHPTVSCLASPCRRLPGGLPVPVENSQYVSLVAVDVPVIDGWQSAWHAMQLELQAASQHNGAIVRVSLVVLNVPVWPMLVHVHAWLVAVERDQYG